MDKTYPVSIKKLESHNDSTTSHANGFDNPVLIIAKTDISKIDPTVNGLYDMGDVSIRTSDKKMIGNIGVDLNVRDGVMYRDGYIQVLSDSKVLGNTVAQITISISPDGTEKYILTNAILKDVNATSPTANSHVATKKYVDDKVFPNYQNSVIIRSRTGQMKVQYEDNLTKYSNYVDVSANATGLPGHESVSATATQYTRLITAKVDCILHVTDGSNPVGIRCNGSTEFVSIPLGMDNLPGSVQLYLKTGDSVAVRAGEASNTTLDPLAIVVIPFE